MRILLTGSSGLVGAAIAHLARDQHEVIGLDQVAGPGTTLIGSILDASLVDRAMRGVDAVIHTAALHAPNVATHSRQAFIDTNISGARLLLESAQRHGVRRFVYTSTTSLYGSALVPNGKAVWVTEALPPQPRDIYDLTKLAAEQLCADLARAGLATIALRISRCYPQPAETIVTYRLSRGVDLRDVAAAHLLALDHPEVTGTFNISAQSPFQEGDCEELLADAAAVIERRAPRVANGFAARGWPLPQTIDRVYSIERARHELGYSPAFNAEAAFPVVDTP